jgi:hypothetical protein
MNEKSRYFDVRSSFWRSCYESALEYEQYLAQSPPQHADRWTETAGKIPPLTNEQLQRLRGHHRVLHILMVSGIWCGDCRHQGPVIKRVVDACDDDVQLRLAERDSNGELRDELRIIGAMRVPVVVFLTEDFFEIGRFGDRTLTTYRKMAGSTLPGYGPTAHSSPQDEWASELSEWVDIFERMLLMARLSPLLRKRHGD